MGWRYHYPLNHPPQVDSQGEMLLITQMQGEVSSHRQPQASRGGWGARGKDIANISVLILNGTVGEPSVRGSALCPGAPLRHGGQTASKLWVAFGAGHFTCTATTMSLWSYALYGILGHFICTATTTSPWSYAFKGNLWYDPTPWRNWPHKELVRPAYKSILENYERWINMMRPIVHTFFLEKLPIY